MEHYPCRPYPRLLDPARFQGEIAAGHRTALFLLRNACGMVVAITNLGAKVLQIVVPDRDGNPGDVALGYDSLDGVLQGAPSMGAFIGRYAGRIAQARFTLEGTGYQLGANAGIHCLHGGPHGSRYQVFDVVQWNSHSLDLHHCFDGVSDGFPGTLDLCLSYHLGNDNELVINHYASVREGWSVASFTSHIFFNLEGAGSIDQHRLQVQATHWLQTDTDNVCTGKRLKLEGHPLDLRQSRRLGSLPDLDHAYEVAPARPQGAIQRVALLESEASGRTLELWSTEPVLQVYGAGALGAGNHGDPGKHGALHRPRGGICLEPQQYPDAPNHPEFPLLRVTPMHPYRATSVYRFGTNSC